MRPYIPVFILSLALAWSAEPLPAPASLPDGVFAVLVVPDLPATLERIEGLAAAISPGGLPPGRLARELGGAFGQAGLGFLAPGPVVVASGPGTPLPAWSVLVPVADPAPLQAFAERRGWFAEVVDGRVLLSHLPDGIELGRRLLAAGLPTADLGSADARLLFAPDRLVRTYGAMVQGLMAMGMQQAQRQGQGQGRPDQALLKLMPGIMAAYSLALEDVALVQEDLSLAGDQIMLRGLLAARPGSALAKALVPGPQPSAKPILGRLPAGPWAIIADLRCSFTPWCDWLDDLWKRMERNPASRALAKDCAWMPDAMRRWVASATGEMAMALGADAEGRMATVSGFGSSDQAAARTQMAEMARRTLGEGLLAGMYKQMGISFEFQAAVRSVGSTEVDRLHVAIDQTRPEAAVMAQGMGDTDLAGIDGAIFSSTRPDLLDAVLTGQAKGLSLASAKAFGPGWDGHADVDLAAWMGLAMSMQKNVNPAAEAMAARFPRPGTVAPALIAWRAAEGKVQGEFRLPVAQCRALGEGFAGLKDLAPRSRRGGRGAAFGPVEAQPAGTTDF